MLSQSLDVWHAPAILKGVNSLRQGPEHGHAISSLRPESSSH